MSDVQSKIVETAEICADLSRKLKVCAEYRKLISDDFATLSSELDRVSNIIEEEENKNGKQSCDIGIYEVHGMIRSKLDGIRIHISHIDEKREQLASAFDCAKLSKVALEQEQTEQATEPDLTSQLLAELLVKTPKLEPNQFVVILSCFGVDYERMSTKTVQGVITTIVRYAQASPSDKQRNVLQMLKAI